MRINEGYLQVHARPKSSEKWTKGVPRGVKVVFWPVLGHFSIRLLTRFNEKLA